MNTAYLKLDAARTVSHINPEIYGHFSEHLGRCIYNGMWVGKESSIPNVGGVRSDVIEALKEIGLPVLRWPGGCYADEYHWRCGIGQRTPTVNASWGYVVEDNSFGTHEFFALCEALSCKTYLAANVGSGSVQELANWLQYLTFGGDSPLSAERRKNGRDEPWQVDYLGIGNENWGCGGNMRPEYYADLYKQYATFARSFSGNMQKVACGPNADNYGWTDSLMQNLSGMANAISLHYYTVPTGDWSHKGDALRFSQDEYYGTIAGAHRIETMILAHKRIMDRHDPEKRVGLIVDEWGNWYDVASGTNPAFLYQQNTMRDAVTAAINLNIFNRHTDRVIMANLAQVVNVLQAVILTDGAQLLKTPTWHVFRLFLPHQGAELLHSALAAPELCANGRYFPQLSFSASKKDGRIYVTLSNASLDAPCSLLLDIAHFDVQQVTGEIITAPMDAYNDFDGKEPVHIADFADFALTAGKLTVTLPPCSVVGLTLQ